jgi:hypothetical protein
MRTYAPGMNNRVAGGGMGEDVDSVAETLNPFRQHETLATTSLGFCNTVRIAQSITRRITSLSSLKTYEGSHHTNMSQVLPFGAANHRGSASDSSTEEPSPQRVHDGLCCSDVVIVPLFMIIMPSKLSPSDASRTQTTRLDTQSYDDYQNGTLVQFSFQSIRP